MHMHVIGYSCFIDIVNHLQVSWSLFRTLLFVRRESLCRLSQLAYWLVPWFYCFISEWLGSASRTWMMFVEVLLDNLLVSSFLFHFEWYRDVFLLCFVITCSCIHHLINACDVLMISLDGCHPYSFAFKSTTFALVMTYWLWHVSAAFVLRFMDVL